jgi:hypothetical protein
LVIKTFTGGRVRPRFGRWDLSRTQSGTRIATTAAPVSAYDQDPKDYVPPRERYSGFPLASAVCPDMAPSLFRDALSSRADSAAGLKPGSGSD